MSIPSTAGVQPSIFTSDINLLKTKLSTIISQGQSKLKIVTDFDSTLSIPNGWSSWCVLEKRLDLTQSYREAIAGLVQIYYPREIDPNLTLDEKIAAMVEWRAEASKLLVGEQISLELYHTILTEVHDYIKLRPGVNDLLQLTNRDNVPVLIFSAGIWDVVDALLYRDMSDIYTSTNINHPVYYSPANNQTAIAPPATPSSPLSPEQIESNLIPPQSPSLSTTSNIRIIANHCQLGQTICKHSLIPVTSHQNDDDTTTLATKLTNTTTTTTTTITSPKTITAITGLEHDPNHPSIHVFNKNETIIQQTPYYPIQLAPRTSIIVMGDSLGDATMVSNSIDDHNVIRVAFLNTTKSKTISTHLQKYLDNFDIVFVDDHSGVDWVRSVIQGAGGSNIVGIDNNDNIVIQDLLSKVFVGTPSQ